MMEQRPGEVFRTLARPTVKLVGASSRIISSGQLIDLVELKSSKSYYVVSIKMPNMFSFGGRISCDVDHKERVIIGWQINPGAIVVDKPPAQNKKRLQLAPTEPCGFYFHLPGPISTSTPPDVRYVGNQLLQIRVMKREWVDDGASVSESSHAASSGVF